MIADFEDEKVKPLVCAHMLILSNTDCNAASPACMVQQGTDMVRSSTKREGVAGGDRNSSTSLMATLNNNGLRTAWGTWLVQS